MKHLKILIGFLCFLDLSDHLISKDRQLASNRKVLDLALTKGGVYHKDTQRCLTKLKGKNSAVSQKWLEAGIRKPLQNKKCLFSISHSCFYLSIYLLLSLCRLNFLLPRTYGGNWLPLSSQFTSCNFSYRQFAIPHSKFVPKCD